MGISVVTVLIKLLLMHILASQYASLSSSTTNNSSDMLALLAFISQIEFPSDSAILGSWNPKFNTSYCNWVGVKCSLRRRLRVTALNLSRMQLQGTISPHIGNLSFLRVLNLGNNNFHGPIPNTVARLRRLRVINLAYNQLQGTIPSSISQCQRLKTLFLGSNHFHGNIPQGLGNLSSLLTLQLQYNHVVGTIPSSVFNISTLRILDLSDNAIYGTIPMDICRKLPNLELVYLSMNPLSGRIPTSLCLCTNLRELELMQNGLTGSIPKDLGCLSNLEYLFLSRNQLTGTIPGSFGNLSKLQQLDLSTNNLWGEIPKALGNLPKLQKLILSGNKLEGSLPYELCQLTSLGHLVLEANKLSGPIPSCIGNLTEMLVISFSSNAFSSIPESIWSLTKVWFLNFSANSLGGYFSSKIENLALLEKLDLSKNKLSGSIPGTLCNQKMLEILNLSGNAFQGNIPLSIGDLASLESLDLSFNNLSGIIPKSLEKLLYLKHFNVSFNMLSGQVPIDGAFVNFTIQSLKGNHDLCGNSKLKLPPCPNATTPPKSRKVTFWLKYVLSSIALLILVASLLILYIKYSRNRKNLQVSSSTDLSIKLGHKFISYYGLLGATNKLSEANLLGIGSYGSVYKGIMSDGEVVAVKVFDLQVDGALTSFDIECQVLRNVRHRNLVKIISCCSNLDFRALVLEFMPNGSLEKWLYNQGPNSCLDIVQRIDIMIDVASGMEYLHHGHSEPIVHCDLKPSNVLLDEDMVAHVGDFGLAKFLAKYKSMTQTTTLGTMGYIAPEFGLQGRVSRKVDVFSYGIMLMETFTRKNPRDEMFVGGLSLRQWVLSSYPHRVMQIVDSSMLVVDSMTNCLSSIMELALHCTRDLPEERLIMTEVSVKVKKIKHDLTTIT